MYYLKVFKEILGLGEWAPPKFGASSATPLGGLGWVMCVAGGAAIMRNPANTWHVGRSIANANHSHLHSIGQACFSAMRGRIGFDICVSWSHVTNHALTACQPLQLLYSLLCD